MRSAKGKDKRPAFDGLHRAAARHEFDVVMAWSVDRLARCRWSVKKALAHVATGALLSACAEAAQFESLRDVAFRSPRNDGRLLGRPIWGATPRIKNRHIRRLDLSADLGGQLSLEPAGGLWR